MQDFDMWLLQPVGVEHGANRWNTSRSASCLPQTFARTRPTAPGAAGRLLLRARAACGARSPACSPWTLRSTVWSLASGTRGASRRRARASRQGAVRPRVEAGQAPDLLAARASRISDRGREERRGREPGHLAHRRSGALSRDSWRHDRMPTCGWPDRHRSARSAPCSAPIPPRRLIAPDGNAQRFRRDRVGDPRARRRLRA